MPPTFTPPEIPERDLATLRQAVNVIKGASDEAALDLLKSIWQIGCSSGAIMALDDFRSELRRKP